MMLQQFKLCLDAAVRDGLIKTNPAAHTKAPQVPRKRVTASDVLSAEELDRLVAAMPDHYKALMYLSGWLGWRWSEAMGLRLCDLDLDAGTIRVGERVAVESDGVIRHRTGGKTDAASRVVPLPEPALRVARWHVATCCSALHPSALLFTTGNGETPYRSNFRRVFQRAVRDAGLENRKINMRQLRHTAASLMLSSGLDILDVQERLGHARGSITLDVYGRVLAGRRTEGTRRMSEVMAQNSNIGFTS
jgi:integrase